jgi:NAD(P)-dependent dehydrogenase (short-subunit alcohol dehydrogenase family)
MAGSGLYAATKSAIEGHSESLAKEVGPLGIKVTAVAPGAFRPARAAQALLAVVDVKQPPLHVLLGSDALRRARENLDTLIEEMDRWEEVTRGTDFPNQPEK